MIDLIVDLLRLGILVIGLFLLWSLWEMVRDGRL